MRITSTKVTVELYSESLNTYLKQTASLRLCYKANGSNNLCIKAYSYAGFACDRSEKVKKCMCSAVI